MEPSTIHARPDISNYYIDERGILCTAQEVAQGVILVLSIMGCAYPGYFMVEKYQMIYPENDK